MVGLSPREATARWQPRRAAVVGLLAAIVVLAAGCGGNGNSDTESPAGTTTPAPTATEADTSPSIGSPPASTTAATTTTEAAARSTTAAPATSSTSTTSSTTPTPDPVPATTAPAPRPEASTLAELVALDRPLVIAHAGGDQDYPHSTLYAFAQSAAAGADVLEIDVQLTADGVLIIQHDDTVDRTTEAAGPVAELTLTEIQALDNAHWFVPGRWGDQTRPEEDYVFRGMRAGDAEPPPGFGPEDFRVATFREVAERFPHHVLNVEIKLQSGPDGEEDPLTGIAAAEVLAAEIAELGREDSVIVACFNDDVLSAFSGFAPSVVTSPGEAALLGWFAAGEALSPQHPVVQVPFTYQGIEVVSPDTVARIHEEGREVWVWLSGTHVVETQEFYADLFSMGVDGVIAGRPAEAVEALQESAP